jgi:hypothetical protein
MTTPTHDAAPDFHGVRRFSASGPLSRWHCGFGWLVVSVLFLGVVRLLGGLTSGDGAESFFSTWAIAHGDPSCAYGSWGFSGIAPLYPLLSGAVSAVVRIGHGVPFPSPAQLGPHCSAAVVAMNRWEAKSGAFMPTVRIGYLGWLVLVAGVVALLRSSGRGRCGWEPIALALIACSPPVFMCVQTYFHPEDLVAMGLVLGGLACARRDRWLWSGVLLGLAVASQQFALLAVAPLFVVAPRTQKLRFAGSTIVAGALITLPMIVITSGRVVKTLSGTGATGSATNFSGVTTVLSALKLHGFLLLATSRILPIVLAMALGWWAQRRLGAAARDPVPLVSLIAASFILRLLFEVSMYGYYFMAATVTLIVLDVIGGRIRLSLIAWIALVTLAFPPLPWVNDAATYAPPVWIRQVVLVVFALGLAASPLIRAVLDKTRPAHGSSRSQWADRQVFAHTDLEPEGN